MTIQILDIEIKGLVRKDDDLKLVIAKANQVKVDTVNRWLREDDVILTTATNLEIIRTHFNYGKNKKLTQEVEQNADAQK